MSRVVLVALLASLALNLYLLVGPRPNDNSPTNMPPPEPAAPTLVRSQLSDNASSRPPVDVPPPEPGKRFDWSSVESDDYKTYIANLRSIGCPAETIRDIVSQDLKKSYKARQWDILRTSVFTNYWSSSFKLGTELNEPELNALRELNEHFTHAHRELVGADPLEPLFSSFHTPEMQLLAQYGNFDSATLDKLLPIHNRLLADLRELGNEDDNAQKNEVIRKAQEEIASHLTLEQRTTFEFRTSRLAKGLREIHAFDSEA